MSDYRDPTTWRHKFVFPNEAGTGNDSFYYRIVQMEGMADGDTQEVTVTYLIRATDLEYARRYFVPDIRTIEGSCIPRVNNAVLQIEANPNYPKLRASRINWRAHISDKPVDPYWFDALNLATEDIDTVITPTYGQVLELVVTYDNRTREVDPNDPWSWLDVRASAAGEFLSIKGHTGRWDTVAGDPVEDAMPDIKTIWPATEWTVIWKNIPKDCFEEYLKPKLDEAMGKINGADQYVDVLFHAPPTTIMFVGYELEQQGEVYFNRKQQTALSIEMKFLEKRRILTYYGLQDDKGNFYVGHQHFWNEKAGKWQFLYLLVEGAPAPVFVYDYYDMNRFFAYLEDEEP